MNLKKILICPLQILLRGMDEAYIVPLNILDGSSPTSVLSRLNELDPDNVWFRLVQYQPHQSTTTSLSSPFSARNDHLRANAESVIYVTAIQRDGTALDKTSVGE